MMTKEEFKQAVIDGLCEGCEEKVSQRYIDGVNAEESFLNCFYEAGKKYGMEKKIEQAILNFTWLI